MRDNPVFLVTTEHLANVVAQVLRINNLVAIALFLDVLNDAQVDFLQHFQFENRLWDAQRSVQHAQAIEIRIVAQVGGTEQVSAVRNLVFMVVTLEPLDARMEGDIVDTHCYSLEIRVFEEQRHDEGVDVLVEEERAIPFVLAGLIEQIDVNHHLHHKFNEIQHRILELFPEVLVRQVDSVVALLLEGCHRSLEVAQKTLYQAALLLKLFSYFLT